MTKKATFIIMFIVVVGAFAAILGVFYVASHQFQLRPPQILGGDTDIHGCKESAGYSWCAVKQKCLRPWEEKCIDPSWKIVVDGNTGASFGYPETLRAVYIHPIDWPPKIQVLSGPFTCTEAGSEIAPAGQTLEHVVGNRIYCVTKESEGAAGSIYTNYAYAFPVGQKVVILTFTLRAVQCDNYDVPQKTECENERASFDIDATVDRIVQSATIK